MILKQFATTECFVCKKHLPMLHEIVAHFDGDVRLEIVDVNTLLDDGASTLLYTVPAYQLCRDDGSIAELWAGTKTKEQIIAIIQDTLNNE